MGDVVDEEKGSRDPIKVKIFGRTDVGLVREHNEDNFLVADLQGGNRSLLPEVRDHTVGRNGTLLAVCDGMGGAAAGEVASQIAVDTVYELMQLDEPPDGEVGLALRLEAAILNAGKKIFQSAKADRTRRGMGTTITAGTLIEGRIIFGQVGDSRAYLIRQGKITQVTRDQSLVNQLIEAGQLKPEEAELFEHSNIILQALGTAEDVTVDLTYVDLRQGDRVLLCSDGLSGLVSDERIRQIVLDSPEPIDACKALTEAARDGGGHDNITVIVAEFDGDGIKPPAEDDLVEFKRLELPGRTPLPTRQPPAPAPDWAKTPTDDSGRPSSPSTPPTVAATPLKATQPTRGSATKRPEKGSIPWGMVIAVVAVLAIGVALGFLFVSGTISGEDAGAQSDGGAAPPAAVVNCNFTATNPNTRLIIDGDDYEEIGPMGRWIELQPGPHNVEARRGSNVEQRQIEVPSGVIEFIVPIFSTLAASPVVDAGQVSVNAGTESSDDGGPKPPDAEPREIPEDPSTEPGTDPTEQNTEPAPETPRPNNGAELPRLPPGAVRAPGEQPPRTPRPPRTPPQQQPPRVPTEIGSDNPYDH
jgi:serine/threonine protein phosphatase PrpC